MTPEAMLAAWPPGTPLAVIWSADADCPRSAWSILAAPTRTYTWPARGAPSRTPAEPIAQLAALFDAHAHGQQPPIGQQPVPFLGGWIGCLSYDLGRVIEPAAGLPAGPPRATDDRHWPGMQWCRCPAAYVHNRVSGQWWVVGEPGVLPPVRLLEAAVGDAPPAFELGGLRSTTGRDAFEDQVRRVIDYIHAGDAFQVNLAHRLTGSFCGSTRALFLELARQAAPWYGAYIETDDDAASDGPKDNGRRGGGDRRAVVSMSPELLAELDPVTRRVSTRPMKGTRRGHAAPAELLASPKDSAELNMIIDLMRNDLGRVCEYRTVRVDEARVIERHGGAPSNGDAGLLQGVATVSGRLRPGAGLADLLRAAFPGGSITGAPKIRAMQIIDELEPVARGPYCGGVGFVSDHGHAAFNVAIRTALVSGIGAPGSALDAIAEGVLDYSVGAGIVADSTPKGEWLETLDKSGVISRIATIHGAPA